jgi:hypothetical protein
MPTKVIRRFELTSGTAGAQEPWFKIEVVLEEWFSGRAAEQDVSFDPNFPHELDADVAD